MKVLHIAVVLAAATITSTSVVKSPYLAQDGNFELLILHNNDMHARFEQTSQLSGTCTTADREAGKCYGGFPRVAHVVKEARAAAASGQGPPVLYLNAGDTYTGTAWFTIYKWKIAAEFINALQPDAVSLGNNELNIGSSELSPLLNNIETQIVSSNVIVKSEEQKLQRSLVFNIQGVLVGLVGYLTPENSILDSAGTIEYIDEVIALQEEVDNLQAQNISIIIALGHASIEKDIEIAKEVEGIDLVIAGHKNTFLWTGASAEEQQIDQIIKVTQKSGKQVPIVQSYAYSTYLGKILVKFDASGEIITLEEESLLLDELIPQDPDSVQILNKLSADLAARSEEIVGQTAVVLEGESCRTEECNLGNLIADAINYYYAVRFEGERWTDAPATIIPGEHLSGSIAPSNRPADVTLGDLLSVIPTESHLVAVTMNGTILLQVLEHAISIYSISNPSGQFLQFSGIRVVYDLARDSGSRVVSAVVRCWACNIPEFYSIDDWRDYKIIMPSSLADGEYGYSMLVDLPKDDLIYDEVTCTAEFIGLRSPVYPEVAGRIEFLNYDEEIDTEETTTSSTTTSTTTTPSTTTIPSTTTTLPTTTTPAPEPTPDSAIALNSTLTVFLFIFLPLIIS